MADKYVFPQDVDKGVLHPLFRREGGLTKLECLVFKMFEGAGTVMLATAVDVDLDKVVGGAIRMAKEILKRLEAEQSPPT